MATIAFRVDAIAQMGSGHLMRCLTLAEAMQKLGHHSVFICHELALDQGSRIEELGFEYYPLSAEPLPAARSYPYPHSAWLPHGEIEDARAFAEVIASRVQSTINWVVVDHYCLGAPWEAEVSCLVAGQPKILAIDDLADRPHQSHALLDQSLGRDKSEYSPLCPSSTLYFIGPDYALLRDEFVRLRHEKSGQKEATDFSVLVTLGGSDPANCSELVLQALEQIELPLQITLLAGALNQRADALKKLCVHSRHRTHFYRHSSEMAKLYQQADLCLGASGASCWERCVVGLPTVSIVLAANQEKAAGQLMDIGAIHNFGYLNEARIAELADTVSRLAGEPDELHKMALKAAAVCDGLGARRVAFSLHSAQNEQPGLLLRKADANDIELVYEWQCQPATRQHARNKAIPGFAEHRSWMTRKLADSQSYFYILEVEASPAGVVRLDGNPSETGEIGELELSIFLDHAYQGMGIAARVLNGVAYIHFCDNIWAFVASENAGSQKLFERSRFERIDSNRFQHRSI